MAHRVTLIPGDGIGPEVSAAVVRIIEAAGVDIEWEQHIVGGHAQDLAGSSLPEEVIESVRRNRVALKGPVATPVGSGFESVNVRLRKILDLYANLRPVRNLPGVPSRFGDVDLVIVRENTEGLYSGLEHEVVPGVVESLKVMTEKASTRIAIFAFEFARKFKRKKVTVVHKANIMKKSDGLFLKCFREVAVNYPMIEHDEKIVDNTCMQLVMNPYQFDVMLMENLYGDIVSDLAAGLVGGLGVVPSGNIGERAALFEAVHGTAPDIAGKNIANPTALLLSAIMMLRHISEETAGNRIESALNKVLQKHEKVTRDLGGKASTSQFAEAIIQALDKSPSPSGRGPRIRLQRVQIVCNLPSAYIFAMLSYSVRTKFLTAGLFISTLVVSACSNSVAGKRADAPTRDETVQVHAIPVKLQELRRNVESVGSLFALEEVTVSSEVEGKVDEVLTDVGDRVERGQPLVNVSTIELKLALDQQRALYQQARARLGITEESDDIKNVLDAAEVKKAAADLKEAEEAYKRSEQLFEKKLMPRQDFDQVDARMHSARAAYDLAVQSVQNLRAQLPQYNASVELAEKKLRDAVIRAPFKGQIKERVVSTGQYLKVQTPVMVIVSVDPLRVRLKIPETMAGLIQIGDRLQVTVDAYPDKTFSGKLSRINPSVDPQSRTFEVEALLKNPDGQLKPGFFVKARIPSGRIDRGMVVPQDALQYSYGIYKVFLIQGDLLKEQDVKVGDLSAQEIEIISGVKAGDMIAVPIKGQVLKDGVKIKIVD